MTLNEIEHTYHKNGDQFISKLSALIPRKTAFNIAFTDNFLSASKAKEISRKMYYL